MVHCFEQAINLGRIEPTEETSEEIWPSPYCQVHHMDDDLHMGGIAKTQKQHF